MVYSLLCRGPNSGTYITAELHARLLDVTIVRHFVFVFLIVVKDTHSEFYVLVPGRNLCHTVTLRDLGNHLHYLTGIVLSSPS